MTIDDFVTTFGYPALFAGAFLEGEIFLLLGGFLAHRGYLDLRMVMITAFLAAFASDQLFFIVGKRKGIALLRRRPQWRARVRKVRWLLDRYRRRMVLISRFLYRLRTICPFVIGMSGFDTRRYMKLNAIGAAVWAVVMASAGYLFGQAVETALEDVKRYEAGIAAVLAAVGVVVLARRYWRLVRGRRGERGKPEY